MKKLIVFILVASLGIFAAGYSWALPVYGDDPTEPTFADWGRHPSLPTESGYYIGSDPNQQNWSLRWTGSNLGDTEWLNWYGIVTIADTQTLTALESTQFDNTDTELIVIDSRTFAWETKAGDLWDGINFSVSGPAGAVMLFQLGVTGNALFDSLVPSPGEVLAQNVFVGENLITPYVEVVSIDGKIYQQFGMDPIGAIPEPGTIFLLGAGLCGLAALGRRRTS